MAGVLLVTTLTRIKKGSVLFIPSACLLKCVFDVDMERCPHCGGSLKIVAAIEAPAVIVRILTHPGLPARAPPRSLARRIDLFEAT